MSSKRRFSGEQKAKIALRALRGERTLQEIAARHQVHPNRMGAWKCQAIDGLAELLSKGAERRSLYGGEVRSQLCGSGRLRRRRRVLWLSVG